jgi:hypothetical protein
MTFQECIRKAIPNASDATVEHVLWGRTAFPFEAWANPARVVYKAADRFRRASEKGIELCDFCNRIAVHRSLCEQCHRALHREAA